MAHREDIKAFLATITIPKGASVVDWCCGTKPIKKYIGGDYSYFGIDKLNHVGADLVYDVCTPLTFKFFDMAFCMEGIEHVEKPDALLKNINTNLKVGGQLYISMPFMFRTHSTEDYWRFTELGLALILKRNGFAVDEIKATEGNAGWLVKAYKL